GSDAAGSSHHRAAIRTGGTRWLRRDGAERAVRRLRPRDRVLANHVRVKTRAELRRPLHRFVVHICDSETLRIPPQPLEIVEQAPEEVALERIAFVDRAVR